MSLPNNKYLLHDSQTYLRYEQSKRAYFDVKLVKYDTILYEISNWELENYSINAQKI